MEDSPAVRASFAVASTRTSADVGTAPAVAAAATTHSISDNTEGISSSNNNNKMPKID